MVTKTKKSEEDTKKTKKTKDTEKEAPARATRASARTTTKKVVSTPTKKTTAKKAAPKKAATTKKEPATKKTTTKTTAKATTKATTKAAPKKTTKTAKEAKASPKKTAKKATTKTTKEPKKAPAAKAPPKKAASKRKTTDDEGSDTEKTKKQKTTEPAAKEPTLPVTDFRIDVQLGPLADVMTMGSGEVGQLGLGKSILGRKRPTPLPELQSKHILKVVPGGLHNAVIVQNDPADPSNTSVWTWGCNDNAVLGRSTPAQADEEVDLSMKPDICPLLEGKHIVEISTGEYHMAALTQTGTLYMWGNYKDNEGFLGYSGSQKNEQQLPKIYPKTAPITIKQVVSGHNHTIALTAQGKVLIWGFHWLGRRVSDRMKRLHLDPQAVMFHKKNGKEPKIVRVAAGGYHSFAFAEDGAIYAWGLNNNGQLGINSNIDQGVPTEIELLRGKNIVDIVGGMHHTIALGADGKVYTFGRGDYGQLGDGKVYEKEEKGSKVPIEVTFFNTLGDKVVNIGTGDNHCTAVTESGAVYAWGFGSSGQIGNADRDSDGDDANLPFKIAGPKLVTPVIMAGAGGQHTIFLVQAGAPLPPSSSSYTAPIASLTPAPTPTPSSSFSSSSSSSSSSAPAPSTSSPTPAPPAPSSPSPSPSSSNPPPSTPPKEKPERKLSQRSETLI